MTVPGGVPAAAVAMCVKARARAKTHALLKPPVLPPTRRGALARRAGEVSTSSGRVLSKHASCSLLMQGQTRASTRPGVNPGRVCAFEPFERITDTISTACLFSGCYWIVTWNVTVAVWPFVNVLMTALTVLVPAVKLQVSDPKVDPASAQACVAPPLTFGSARVMLLALYARLPAVTMAWMLSASVMPVAADVPELATVMVYFITAPVMACGVASPVGSLTTEEVLVMVSLADFTRYASRLELLPSLATSSVPAASAKMVCTVPGVHALAAWSVVMLAPGAVP